MKKKKQYGLLIAWIILLVVDWAFRGLGWLAHNLTGIRFLANYLLSAIALLGLLYLFAFIRKKAVFWIFYSLLIVLPMLLQGNYFIVYKKFISPSDFAIFAESPRMVLGVGAANLNWFFLLAGTFFILIAGFALQKYKPRKKWMILPAGAIFIGISIFLTLQWYSVDFFQHSTVAFYDNLTQEILSGKEHSLATHRLKLLPVRKSENPPNLVFVVGESQVLSHMSLYGYPRQTTPLLDSLYKAHRIIPFQKAVSVGNKTRLSVPYMLSGLQGPDPKGAFFEYPSIFDYAKAAGYHTLFLSAQDLHWGKLGALFNDGSVDLLEDGNYFSSHVDVLKGVDDLVMLPHVFHFLKKYGSPFLLVVQMDGSHYPYNEHSPDSLKRFLPEKKPNGVNAFDNTLVVTDIYLTRLYAFLAKNFPHTFMFFTPDHGQNFGGLNGHFNDNFTRDVFHNALIAFPPAGDSVAYNLMMKKENRLVSQSDIFATMLDLMKIRPQYVVDGVSLLDTNKRRRVVTCSEYMPTFHNNPLAVVVDSAMQTRLIDFSRMSVTDSRTGKVYPYRKLPLWIRKVINYRLQRKVPVKALPDVGKR